MKNIVKLLLIFLFIPIVNAGYTATVFFPDTLITLDNKTSSDTLDLGTALSDTYTSENGNIYYFKEISEEVSASSGIRSKISEIKDKFIKIEISQDIIRDLIYILIFFLAIFFIFFIFFITRRAKKRRSISS